MAAPGSPTPEDDIFETRPPPTQPKENVAPGRAPGKTKAKPRKPSRKRPRQDDAHCPICLEAWTSTGDHRIVSLACGHLFGELCVLKWIKSRRGKGATCPQCGVKAKKGDIRAIYVPTVTVVDAGRVEELQRTVDSEKHAREQAERELAELRLRFLLVKSDYQTTLAELAALKRAGSRMGGIAVPAPTRSGRSVRPNLLARFTLGVAAAAPPASRPVSPPPPPEPPVGAVVQTTAHAAADVDVGMDVAKHPSDTSSLVTQHLATLKLDRGRLVVAARDMQLFFATTRCSSSSSSLYGVAQVCALKPERGIMRRIPMHKQQVRDIKYLDSPSRGPPGLLLTVGMDFRAVLTDLRTSAAVLHYQLPAPGFSCCGTADANVIATGLANGRVLLFDLRKTGKPLFQLPSCRQPVHSLVAPPLGRGVQSLMAAPGGPSGPRTALLAGTIGGVWGMHIPPAAPPTAQAWTSLRTAATGPIASVAYTPSTLLVTCRGPSRGVGAGRVDAGYASHMLHGLDARALSLTPAGPAEVLVGHSSETVLGHSCVFPLGDPGQLCVASGDEATNGVALWTVDVSAGSSAPLGAPGAGAGAGSGSGAGGLGARMGTAASHGMGSGPRLVRAARSHSRAGGPVMGTAFMPGQSDGTSGGACARAGLVVSSSSGELVLHRLNAP